MIVFIEGRRVEIREPRTLTLKKYGLSLDEWKNIVAGQGYKCPICLRVLDKMTNIDHVHVRHWKKMSPENRKKYVRGVTCWFDNKNTLSKGLTVEKSQRTTNYLRAFEERRPK